MSTSLAQPSLAGWRSQGPCVQIPAGLGGHKSLHRPHPDREPPTPSRGHSSLELPDFDAQDR